MKKLNIAGITAGLDTIKGIVDEANSIARDELIDAGLIDFAARNSYASEDTEESIRELADQIEAVGLLNPLGVVKENGRYTLFSGERRYRAITEYLHWDKIPCRVFEGVKPLRAQLMLHIANGAREYSPAKKLELYEEYSSVLRQMKESGEFTGSLQDGIANLLNVSTRQVRTYRMMAEQLRPEEKNAVKNGEWSFGDAKIVAGARAEIEKTGTGSGFDPDKGQTEDSPAAGKEDPEAGEPATSHDLKSGTASGFEIAPAARIELLKEAMDQIWGRKKLRDAYLQKMPTTQEAIKEILRPTYGYQAGTLVHVSCSSAQAQFYTCTSQIVELQIFSESGSDQKIMYKYSEVDGLIRQMYRAGQLCRPHGGTKTKEEEK